ncbi:MAG: GspE/PulE family protein [Nitrospiraceae bacterium]|nr:GspE/PulE family protein [Nitrospirota bacterium]MDA8338019.1 GspE/PulE family protein [Nitrospiraceae bacterium]
MAFKKPTGKSFEELLIERGLLTKEKLQDLLTKITKEKKSLEQLLLESGFSEEKIAAIKAEYLGYEFVDLSSYPQPPVDLLKHIKPAYAKNYKVVPVKYEDEVLTIAMVEPRDFMALDEVIRLYRDSKFRIKDSKVVMTTTKHLFSAIEKFYAVPKDEVGMGNILSQLAETYRPEIEVAEVAREDATENSAPIVMLANKIVEEAFQKRTSDIHIEPALDHLRVRYRVDGELAEVMRVPRYAQDALITRFKIMSDMRIDERRQPQDGRIDFTKYNPAVEIDLRVSTVPTPHGEDVVMRILDKKSSILSLDMLGFNEHNMKLYREAISAPYGILLHVGPTGSGKTTALYAALKSLDTSNVKIVTAEDPVEYTLGGQIIQSNVNPAAGYTFAKAIRAFMRHDPDIILIGEIRDIETAKTAVEASLTGHLVFSTLHTNDAIGTVTRLTEMGIEPYLVADSLLLVCAQRLMRRICKKCKESYIVTDEEVEMAKGDIKPGTTLYRGKGCDACEGTGYKGRTGIYEVLAMNKQLRSLLIKEASTEELRKTAIETGMLTLRQDAIEKALTGVSTIEEVVSSTLAEG